MRARRNAVAATPICGQQIDLQNGRQFEDVIALCGYPIDIHDPTGAGGGAGAGPPTADIYEIPYRVMVPEAVDGLLLAGRAVSSTHEALSAIRVMPPCFAMGEAAGTAAAIARKRAIAPRAVPIADLHGALLAAGAYLGADREI